MQRCSCGDDLKGKAIIAGLVLALLLIPGFSVVLGESSQMEGWPMYRGYIYARAQSPYDVSSNPGEVKYIYAPYGEIEGAPVIGPDGTIYLSTNAGIEVIRDGKKVWNFTYPYVTQNPSYYVSATPPAIDRYNNIYVANVQEKRLYAFKPDGESNWTINWTYDIKYYWGFSPILVDGKGHIFFGNEWEMVALTTSGQKMWNISSKQPYFSTRPSVYGNTVYFVRTFSGSLTDKPQLYAVDIPTGNVLWNYTVNATEKTIVSTPVVSDNGTVYILATNGMLYGIQDGRAIMSFNIGSPGALAMDKDGNIYASGGKYIYSWYPNGTLRWKIEPPLPVWHFVLDSKCNIAAFLINSSAREIDLALISSDGDMKWNMSIAGPEENPFEPVIGPDGTIYVGIDYYGGLIAIGEKQTSNNTEGSGTGGTSGGAGGTNNGTDGTSEGNTGGESSGDTGNGENTGNSGSTPGFEAVAMIATIGIVAYVWRRKTI